MSAEPAAVAASAAGARSRRRFALALAALTCLAFAPVLGNEFVLLDDNRYITDNPHVTRGLTLQGLRWALTSTDRDNWQPLTWIGHMLAVEISGVRPWGHHLLSVLLHALAAALLFVFLVKTTGRRPASLFVAALFALHPLRLESVAWAAELKDPLSGVFFMLALLCHAGFAARRRVRDYLALALVFALGLMAKPTLVMLPALLLLLDFWPLARWSRAGAWRLLLEKAPLLVLAAAAGLLTLKAQAQGGAIRALDAIPLGARLQNALVSAVSYIVKLIWPFQLSVFYPLPAEAHAAAAVIGAATALLAITIGALLARRRAPAVAVGWFWYLAMLAPVLGIVQVGLQAMADRYTYLPQVGLGVALAWGASGLARAAGPLRGPRPARALFWAAALFLLGLAALTPFRARVWHDSVRLFANALASDPDNWFAHLKLAEVHLSKERIVESLAHAQRSVAAKPDFPNTRLILGILLGRYEREREAEAQFREALRLAPLWPEALHHLGLALFRQDRLEEALAALQQELRHAPASPRALMSVAVVEHALGRLDDAEARCRTWLHVEPGSALARILLGRIAEARGQSARALAVYREALALDPRLGEARAAIERLGAAPP